MKIRKRYNAYAQFFGSISTILCGIIAVSLLQGSLHILVLLAVGIMIFSNIAFYHFWMQQTGVAMNRYQIKKGVKFRLEKIPGPGNEELYFIYEGSKKLLYTDTSEFRDGWYIKQGDSLLEVKNHTESIPA